MTKELMLDYIKFLLDFLPAARPILLLYDGHDTHIFLALLEYCISRGVTALQVPSHSTSITQGCDQLFGAAVSCTFLCTSTDTKCGHTDFHFTEGSLR
jgi:hypothetical protein